MKKKLSAAYILLYNFIGFTAAIGGWLWEVLVFLAKERQFVNRGFLYGPWLPVYGVGAIALSILFYYKNIAAVIIYAKQTSKTKLLQNKSAQLQKNQNCLTKSIRIFLICMFGGSLVEFAIGWFLWHVFHRKYWDYTGYFLNISGYVCLLSALGFGIFGFLWIKWIAPRLIRLWEKLRFSIQILIIGLLDVLLITDAVFSLMQPNSGENITFSFFSQ